MKACTDGEEGAYYLQQNAYDLALVDWMLPGESGPDILRESRRKGIMTPVVMLTALTAVENKVTCLDAGADDYLGKPFDSRELLARVRANLRRQAPIEELVVLRYGDLVYDTKALLLACGREEIAVSKKLGLMIELFMKARVRRWHEPPCLPAYGARTPTWRRPFWTITSAFSAGGWPRSTPR